MMLLHLTILLHKAMTTTVVSLFPFLCLTFSLLRVLGRMRTMAKLMCVRCYLHTPSGQKAHHANVDSV